jgi:predicted metal-dependent peptidase
MPAPTKDPNPQKSDPAANRALVERLKAQTLVLGWKISPFFMPGLARIEFRADERIATACVQINGIVRFSPKWAATLSDPEVRFVIAHEIMHLFMMHHGRRGTRKHGKWNFVNDKIINYNLKEIEKTLVGNTKHDIFRMPKCGVIATDAEAELTSEELYNQTPDDPGLEGQDPEQTVAGNGCGVMGDSGSGSNDDETPRHEDGTPLTRDEIEAAKRQWHEAAVQAQMEGQRAGDGAGNLLAKLLNVPEPKVRWGEVLRGALSRALAAAGHDDVSWSRRSRRSNTQFIFPGGVTHKCRVSVVIDTSGSMSDDDLNRAVAETTAIVNHTNVPVFLVVHDAGVQEACWIRPGGKGNVIKFVSSKMKGRGGTSFDEAYERVGKERGRFNTMVHLTDGEIWGTWPPKPANVHRTVVALLGSKNHKDVPVYARAIDVEI